MVDLLNYMMVILLILLFLSLSLCLDVLTIKVVDTNEKPIYNANVEILGSDDLGYSSDKDGLLVMDKYLDEFLSIKVSHIAYESKILNLDLRYRENIVVMLSENILDYDDVVVTGTKLETYIKDVPVLTHVISSEDLEKSVYNSVKEVLEMTLPNVQNVMSTHAGVSNDRMKIQGLDNKYILFMIDGVRVSGEFAGNLDFSMLDLSNVEKIEIIEGGMSSLYGSSAVGGVVNIITKKNNKPANLNYSYLHDAPSVVSQSLNLGLNHKNLYYDLNLVNQKSDGYDLTLYDSVYGSDTGGPYIKTLEMYETNSLGHSIRFDLSQRYFFEFNYKNFIKEIFLFQEHKVPLTSEPFFGYYDTYQHEMPKAEDRRIGFSFVVDNEKSLFKILLNKEEYTKGNVYFNYTDLDCSALDLAINCNDSSDLINQESVNAIHSNQSLNIEYNKKFINHNVTFGYEENDDSYSSFNIYKHDGDDGNNGLCDNLFNSAFSDCEYVSIFGSENGVKYFNKKALYFGDQFSFDNNDKINFSIRYVDSDNYNDNMVYSIAYMLKKYQPYDLRFNYTKGFRTPAIKELFYNFLGHSPPVIGDEDLKPTTNDHFAISVDKRIYNNSFSFELFYNDVKDMIAVKSVDYDSDEVNSDTALQYSNFESVIIDGFNCHYDRKLNNRNQLKFVYNYTNSNSTNIEALEMISRHSFKMNYLYDIILNKMKFSLNIKYSDKKFLIIDSNKIWLNNFFIIDGMFMLNVKDFLDFKFGCKNILDYKDDRRFSSEYLSSYDPGRRFVAQINFKY